MLSAGDGEGLASLGSEEELLVERLRDNLRRREELLRLAAEQDLPHKNLQSLADALPSTKNSRELRSQLKLSKARARLLQHHGLTNWVIAQRTLIHLSQMLEIIATGGRLRPTYEKGPTVASGSGALVDQEA